MTGDNLHHDTIEQASWLRLARRQSQTLAATREALRIPPARWESAEQRARPVRRLARIAWAMVLPALMLGGVTGTWAFVNHIRTRSNPEVSQPATTIPPPVAPTPASRIRDRRHVGVVVPRDEARVVVERPIPPRVAPRRRPVPPVVIAAPADGSAQIRQTIVVPTLVTGEDQVIIVTPPAKLRPLWTAESYKQRGPQSVSP